VRAGEPEARASHENAADCVRLVGGALAHCRRWPVGRRVSEERRPLGLHLANCCHFARGHFAANGRRLPIGVSITLGRDTDAHWAADAHRQPAGAAHRRASGVAGAARIPRIAGRLSAAWAAVANPRPQPSTKPQAPPAQLIECRKWAPISICCGRRVGARRLQWDAWGAPASVWRQLCLTSRWACCARTMRFECKTAHSCPQSPSAAPPEPPPHSWPRESCPAEARPPSADELLPPASNSLQQQSAAPQLGHNGAAMQTVGGR